jgi:hypothetical protein
VNRRDLYGNRILRQLALDLGSRRLGVVHPRYTRSDVFFKDRFRGLLPRVARRGGVSQRPLARDTIDPMSTNSRRSVGPDRPAFAVILGLLPPYTMDDVKRAYRDKVKDAHPDRGGDRATFERIQMAFEEASEYLKFRSDRRLWIAARMEEYLAVGNLIETMRGLGAGVDSTMLDWVRQSFGDFADLTVSITGVRLHDSQNAAELVDAMIGELPSLPGLKRLSLAGCKVDNLLALELRVFKSLADLDLSRTQIGDRALTVVEFLPDLVSLNVEGTGVGWWARHKAERLLRKRRQSRPDPIFHPVNVR